MQPQSTRVEEPTLLCNQVRPSTHMDDFGVKQDLRCSVSTFVESSRANMSPTVFHETYA
jgi:hypothetical protein